jgi:hypothetical protein
MGIQIKRLKEIVKNSKYYDGIEIRERGKEVIFKGEFYKETAYLTSYGWIFARWDNINNDYKCTFHIRNTPQGFCYCYARSLEELASNDTVKKFKSIQDAARAICE